MTTCAKCKRYGQMAGWLDGRTVGRYDRWVAGWKIPIYHVWNFIVVRMMFGAKLHMNTHIRKLIQAVVCQDEQACDFGPRGYILYSAEPYLSRTWRHSTFATQCRPTVFRHCNTGNQHNPTPSPILCNQRVILIPGTRTMYVRTKRNFSDLYFSISMDDDNP